MVGSDCDLRIPGLAFEVCDCCALEVFELNWESPNISLPKLLRCIGGSSTAGAVGRCDWVGGLWSQRFLGACVVGLSGRRGARVCGEVLLGWVLDGFAVPVVLGGFGAGLFVDFRLLPLEALLLECAGFAGGLVGAPEAGTRIGLDWSICFRSCRPTLFRFRT